MSKKVNLSKYIITAFVAVCLVSFGIMFSGKSQADNEERRTANQPALVIPESAQFETEQITVKKADGEILYFDVEVAVTPTQQARGLMYRKQMDEDSGMLFLFDYASKRSFWMKNTLIPLDLVFLHHDGIVHHIHHNAKPQDLTSITSKHPAKAVLELNGGTSDKMGIKEGDQVQHPFFNNTGLQK